MVEITKNTNMVEMRNKHEHGLNQDLPSLVEPIQLSTMVDIQKNINVVRNGSRASCGWLLSRPQGKVVKKVALIGKGLTFDSGGYNIKVGQLHQPLPPTIECLVL